LLNPYRRGFEKFTYPFLDVTIRLDMASIFLTSGWQKFQSWRNGDWESTLFLFREEHIVPLIPPDVAAVLGTGAEIILPLLLVLGLSTRISALGLMIMTIIIQFFLSSNIGKNFSQP
jgi:putative oxidoreductase